MMLMMLMLPSPPHLQCVPVSLTQTPHDLSPSGNPSPISELETAVHCARNARGGYCFVVVSAFAALLRALGYRVSLHTAAVSEVFKPLLPLLTLLSLLSLFSVCIIPLLFFLGSL